LKQMKILGVVLSLALVTACTDPGSAGPGDSVADEPPFFVADRDATGPLTLAELQINIPDEIDKALNDSKRSCFFDAVERRANEAGDPAHLEPDAFPYWGGKIDQDDWSQHSKYMQRVLLAQAIISWAMSDC
jgi:hypothetical protein